METHPEAEVCSWGGKQCSKQRFITKWLHGQTPQSLHVPGNFLSESCQWKHLNVQQMWDKKKEKNTLYFMVPERPYFFNQPVIPKQRSLCWWGSHRDLSRKNLLASPHDALWVVTSVCFDSAFALGTHMLSCVHPPLTYPQPLHSSPWLSAINQPLLTFYKRHEHEICSEAAFG